MFVTVTVRSYECEPVGYFPGKKRLSEVPGTSTMAVTLQELLAAGTESASKLIAGLKVAELKAVLKEAGASEKGKKAELVARLEEVAYILPSKPSVPSLGSGELVVCSTRPCVVLAAYCGSSPQRQ